MTKRKSAARSLYPQPPAYAEWDGVKINLIDTPGYNIFINDAKAGLLAADAALVVVDAVNGIEIQTEKTWKFADDYGIPQMVFANKMHKERASVAAVVDRIKEVFGVTAVPLQHPLGEGKDFAGVVDLISMKTYTYALDGKRQGNARRRPRGHRRRS